jgi:hypothetical protein
VAPDNTNDAAAALVSLGGTSNLILFKRKHQVGRMDLVDTDNEDDIESSTLNKKNFPLQKLILPAQSKFLQRRELMVLAFRPPSVSYKTISLLKQGRK